MFSYYMLNFFYKLILEYFIIKNIKHFRTYPGQIWGTLGTSRNYFRMVHLGSELHL